MGITPPLTGTTNYIKPPWFNFLTLSLHHPPWTLSIGTSKASKPHPIKINTKYFINTISTITNNHKKHTHPVHHPSSEQARRIRLGQAWKPKPTGNIQLPDLSNAFKFVAGEGMSTNKGSASSTAGLAEVIAALVADNKAEPVLPSTPSAPHPCPSP
jgi:hypothetical protein